MKFVHIADFHLDSTFANLSEKEGLGEICRLGQWKVLKNIIEYIKENNIENLFISGDLYEQKYIKESTIKHINNLFSEIPQTKIYISPGNHDPYIKNSYYNRYKWAKNVKIFKSKIDVVQTPQADIYGVGFDDFYCTSIGLEGFEIKNKDKINILVTHADLDATINTDKPYNPISTKLLQSKGFDYIALGHIHKPMNIGNIVYPGSTFPLGFDEQGARGMVVGEILISSEDKKVTVDTKFIPLNEIAFNEIALDITNCDTKEELIAKLNEVKPTIDSEMPVTVKHFIKIILTGNRNFEFDKYDLLKYTENESIIRIKDATTIAYNLDDIANNSTLKGIYVEQMKQKLNSEQDEHKREIIEKAIEIGLKVLE